MFSRPQCSICNPPIILHWCLTERDRSAVPMLQAQMGVSIRVAADLHKLGTRAFCGTDVLTPERSKLDTVCFFGGKVLLVGCLL